MAPRMLISEVTLRRYWSSDQDGNDGMELTAKDATGDALGTVETLGMLTLAQHFVTDSRWRFAMNDEDEDDEEPVDDDVDDSHEHDWSSLNVDELDYPVGLLCDGCGFHLKCEPA